MNRIKQLNRENNRLNEQLDGEYESVMTDLVCYLRGTDITDGQAERVRQRVVNALSIALTCAGVLGLSKTLISPTALGVFRALAARPAERRSWASPSRWGC